MEMGMGMEMGWDRMGKEMWKGMGKGKGKGNRHEGENGMGIWNPVPGSIHSLWCDLLRFPSHPLCSLPSPAPRQKCG